MVTFDQIVKKFKVDFWDRPFTALDSVSFSITPGKIVGFLGENGAGKTTLIKIMLGLISSTSGKVNFSKEMGHTRQQIMANIGYLPERPYFYPHLTGREFVTYMGKLCDVENQLISERIHYWGNRLEIYHAVDRKLHTYSKGMLQRIGLISAIIHDPLLIILDEPLSGLDPIGRKIFKEVLLQLFTTGKTIFFSSHIVPDVEEIAERVIFVSKGKLVYEGKIQDVVDDKLRPTVSVKYLIPKTAISSRDEVKKIFISNQITLQEESVEDWVIYAHVLWENKEDLLRKILSLNGRIDYLEKHTLTLEEVLYNLKMPRAASLFTTTQQENAHVTT